MKIKKTVLLQIIKEETKKILTEQSEAELNYLASLGTDEDMLVPRERAATHLGRARLPYFRPAVEPVEAMNLRQIGMDPADRDLRYNTEYNPGPRRYRRGEEETYIPLETVASQQYPYSLPALEPEDIEDWNRREMQRVTGVADIHQQLSGPSGGEWIPDAEMREPVVPGLPGAIGHQVDWDIPEYFDEEADLARTAEGAFEQLPKTGGVFVRSTSKGGYYGTPHMEELINSLKDVAGGGWFVGDVSLEHGGDISSHVSHEAGVDADISLPTIDRDGMSTRANDRGCWGFRNIRPRQMDYDRTVEFLRRVGSRAGKVLLDPMFFPGIKAKMDELLASGEMSDAEYRRISGVDPRHGSRQTQRSWGRVSNYWGNGLLKSQPDGAHKNHFHLRLRGVYPKGDARARGQRNRPATARSGDRDTGTSI